MDEIDYCTNCNCHFPVAKSPESVQQEVKEAQKELKVETKEMSQQVRKKTSVPDQRLSSQAVGLICVVTLSSIFTVVIACDACRLLHYLLHSRNKHLKNATFF
ncbi:hypothetical protein C0Q70_10045 [Pomacea canaliculata]|uniref:Uncharacterized protein n=1 Tax=Pomacea canaliculata TaxID=400727 RepID=A0A2T7PBH5_POMCA|nr:hypothetical protein C0Q70_10045 [Pomacea canaliculata]